MALSMMRPPLSACCGDICVFEPVTQSSASAMIDTSVLGCPKVRLWD